MNTDTNQDDPHNENSSNSKLRIIIQHVLDAIKPVIEAIQKKVDNAIAKMRAEFFDTKEEVGALRAKVNLMEDYVKSDLISKITELKKMQVRQAKESRAANFLSSNGGLLFNVSEMLTQANRCVTNPDAKEIQKFIGYYLWPLNNKLVVYDRQIDAKPTEVDTSMPVEKLIDIHRTLSGIAKPTPNLDLMEALSPILHEISASDFELRLENMQPFQAAELVQAKTIEMAQTLKAHGIGIIYHPDNTTIRFFAKPKSGEVQRPLVIRLSDQLVYTPGISDMADDYQSLY